MFQPKMFKGKSSDTSSANEEPKSPNPSTFTAPSNPERLCFLCNKVGYLAKDCRPSLYKERPTTKRAVSALEDEVASICMEANPSKKSSPDQSSVVASSVSNGLDVLELR